MGALVHLLSLLLLLHPSCIEAQQVPLCQGGKYSPNDTFESNLNLLLANLSSSVSIFSNLTVGTSSPDLIYGLVLCRGDLDPSSCNNCYQMLSKNVTQLCPYFRRATVWDYHCELRYSDSRFFSSISVPEIFDGLESTNSAESFADMSRVLFDSVSYEAAFESPTMFATGKLTSYYDEEGELTMYSLAQCTMDLERERCSYCLKRAFYSFWSAWKEQEGVWYFGQSCNYRCEVGQFYRGNATVVLTNPPTTATSSSSSSPLPAVPSQNGGK